MGKGVLIHAGDVSIENALQYIEAIDMAVRRDIRKLPKDERSMAVSVVAGAMAVNAESLVRFRAGLEANGEADPVSEEQKLQLRLLFRRAVGKDKPES